jgi:hypothetical protein
MENKTALYWAGKGRNFRRQKTEVEGHFCPKCKADMVRRLSDIDLGDRKYVWVCSAPACLYVISINKVASLDLTKIKEDLGARAKVNFIDDSMLEVSHEGKKIYLNSAGEIWTSEANSVKSVQSPVNAVKEIRKMMASGRLSFEITAEDLLKHGDPVLAEPVVEDSPAEIILVEVGSDIIKDLMSEPEVSELCPEDQNELAVMAFDELLFDKKQAYLKKSAIEISRILSRTFENMTFEAIGDKIKISFDAKMATGSVSQEEFREFIFAAISDSDFYSQISNKVDDIREKAAAEIPDFFRIRDVLLNEIKEQQS